MGYKVKKIYQGTNLVRPAGWTPGANTLAYYPLTSTSTVNDMSGNSKTMTNNRSVQFGTYAGVNCGYFSGGSSGSYLSRSGSLWTGASSFTASIWAYKTSATTTDGIFFGVGGANGYNCILTYVESGSKIVLCGYSAAMNTDVVFPSNSWNLITITYDGTSCKGYLNGTLLQSKNFTFTIQNTITCIGQSVNTGSTRPRTGYLSECIFENKARTATEIQDYYNQTKSKYGL